MAFFSCNDTVYLHRIMQHNFDTHFLFRINTTLKMVNNMQFFFSTLLPNYKLLVPLHFHKFPFHKRLFWVQPTRVSSIRLAVMCASQCYLLCALLKKSES